MSDKYIRSTISWIEKTFGDAVWFARAKYKELNDELQERKKNNDT